MGQEYFNSLLDAIVDFADSAVIDLSLWGELALHSKKIEIIRAVLERKLPLLIETCGIGWQDSDFNELAKIANEFSGVSWIFNLDNIDYGNSIASKSALRMAELFPFNVYVQAIRTKGAQNALKIEKFYRYWQSASSDPDTKLAPDSIKVIIQKYDNFCGKLPDLRAADISPLDRAPCWHNMRDMNILLDGTVVKCKEDLDSIKHHIILKETRFSGDLKEDWNKGAILYDAHCKNQYPGLCGECDEYYTYNF
jgi:spiro-SPASM protein